MRVAGKWGWGLALMGLAVLIYWGVVGGSPPTREERFAQAERLLHERLDEMRRRAEGACSRVAELAGRTGAGEAALFAAAEKIRSEASVDGVAILRRDSVARCWAGRTFDADPDVDLAGVARGFELVEILDRPAQRILLAARPAGEEIAVAFVTFDEWFPQRRDLAREVADESGLERVRLRYNSRTVPVRAEERVVVIDSLVHATLVAPSDATLRLRGLEARRVRLHTLLFAAAILAAVLVWRLAGRRLAKDAISRTLLFVALLVALRWLLAMLGLPALPLFNPAASTRPLWAGPGDTALTGLTALVCAIALARAARVERSRRTNAALALAGGAACVFLPRLYASLIALLVRREDGIALFDPLQVAPDWTTALLLGGLCLATGALFLCVHSAFVWSRRVHRALAPLPFLALVVGLFSWDGVWLAGTTMLATCALLANTTRPEKAAAFTFLAALASLPVLYTENRDVFVSDVAARAQDLVRHSHMAEANDQLRAAVDRVTQGVDREVAHSLAAGRAVKRAAFKLWAAARWDLMQPCAVQVWDAAGKLVSVFDFDSPPAQWLPEPPSVPEPGERLLRGRRDTEGETLRFYTRAFELRTIGDERLVGRARFAVPDRWDVLLSPTLRPSLFTVPYDRLVRSAAPPLLVAELAPTGTPLRTSTGATADVERPSDELLSRARRDGYASERVTFRERDARLVLAPGRFAVAALVFEDSLLQQGSVVFAKVLLTYSALCLLYVLGLLVVRRGRVTLLFRHRVALFLIAMTVPPALILAQENRRAAETRHRTEIADRLQRPLDVAETLLRERELEVDGDWHRALTTGQLVDINVYRGQELVATGRPGLWDTGLLGSRLAAKPYVALVVEERDDYRGFEYFGGASSLQAAYRRVVAEWGDEDAVILGAPALVDRRALERRAAQSDALLLSIYLLTATSIVFLSLFIAGRLTQPVQDLREATARVAGGDLDQRLPETREDEFGDLIRAFNRMTRELREVQDLRVRAEKSAAWREMARQVAHEIKNPLTPIKLTVQNLLASHDENEGEFDEQFDEGAKLILDQIGALHRIADAFSAYARLPSQRLQPVDLAGLARDVAALYGAEDETPGEPLVVRADPDELRSVVSNLVMNARQANASRVTVRVAADGAWARLDVIDDGAGIPREVQARIFEPSFTTKTSGTGLGMPIVKRIVDDYGGTIELDSEPGRGTRATIRLPLSET